MDANILVLIPQECQGGHEECQLTNLAPFAVLKQYLLLFPKSANNLEAPSRRVPRVPRVPKFSPVDAADTPDTLEGER